MEYNRLYPTILAHLSRGEEWLSKHKEKVLTGAICFLVVLGAPRLVYQIWRLLFKDGGNGANDLRYLHGWVVRWFEGDPFRAYILLPATFPTLWPITGWLSIPETRWLWLGLYVIAFWSLVRILRAETGIQGGKETALLALFLLTIYPTGVTIGNGQMILLLLPAVLGGLIISRDGDVTPLRRAAAVALLVFSTSKLTVTAPFFLILLISIRDFRTAATVAVSYVALTFFALHFRDMDISEFISRWIKDTSNVVAIGGHGNIHHFLGSLGVKHILLPASAFLFAALGLWIYKYRKTDFWVQLGVAAILARFWTYHRLYDDLLIIIPMTAVLRLLKSGTLSENERTAAGAIFAVSFIWFLIPGFFLQLPHPWGVLFRGMQIVIWLSLFIFLMYYAYAENRKERDPAGFNPGSNSLNRP